MDEPEAGKEYPRFIAVPFYVTGSSRWHDDFTFSAGLAFTWVNFSGTADAADLEAIGGASTIMFRPASSGASPELRPGHRGPGEDLSAYSGVAS
ncbi:MAG: hypothetical protein R3F43_25835 [bacterium]